MLSLPSRLLSRRLPVLLYLTIRLLRLPLHSRTCSRSVAHGLARPPNAGYGLWLLPMLGLLSGRPLQQLLLVQHLRRQLPLRKHHIRSALKEVKGYDTDKTGSNWQAVSISQCPSILLPPRSD